MTAPYAAIVFLLGWMTAGTVLAVHLIRRGHEARPMIALALGLGPLMLIVASAASDRRRSARPVTLTEGVDHGGSVHVLVLVQGEPAAVRWILPNLEAIAPDLAVLTIARAVPYELLAGGLDASYIATSRAVLAEAGDLMPISAPQLTLWPGPPDVAADRFRREHRRSLVLTAVDPVVG